MTAPDLDRGSDTKQQRCIAVQVGGARYAVPLDEVQEVIAMRPLTRVFHAPPAIAGVTSLRGDVLPVLDLGTLLGALHSGVGAEARIVVVREATGARRRAGLAVDELAGLRDVPPEGLAPTPSTLIDPARELIAGVITTAPPCAVLSVTALLDSPLVAPLATRDAG